MHSGACLCNQVRFHVEGEMRAVVNCHCSDCRRFHGHHGAYSQVAEKQLSFLTKKTLKWHIDTKAKRGFCKQCGSGLFWHLNDSPLINIAAGALKKPTGLTTVANIFCQDKGDYYPVNTAIKCYRGSMYPINTMNTINNEYNQQ